MKHTFTEPISLKEGFNKSQHNEGYAVSIGDPNGYFIAEVFGDVGYKHAAGDYIKIAKVNAQRINDCVNALAGIENPAKLDFEFIAQALNAHWNAMNWNLTEVKDLGDIERKNYEYAREKAKEQLALLTQ